MHNRAGCWTVLAARYQVVHGGSAADAGGVRRAVAALGFHGPARGPQHAPGGSHRAYVAAHFVGDCRAGDRDVAAGAVIGVLSHHRGDRHQRRRGNRHPLLRAHLTEARRVRPTLQPLKPAGATSPHRSMRCTRPRALHPPTTSLVGVRSQHVRAARRNAFESNAKRCRPFVAGTTKTAATEVTICALDARLTW